MAFSFDDDDNNNANQTIGCVAQNNFVPSPPPATTYNVIVSSRGTNSHPKLEEKLKSNLGKYNSYVLFLKTSEEY